MQRFYIAGPMRGVPFFNFPAFDEAERFLRASFPDSVVFNPCDLDREAGFDPFELPDHYDWNFIPEGFDLESCIRRDLDAILDSDVIYLLPGWENSTGAKAELAVAKWNGLKVLHAPEARREDVDEDDEVRVVDEETGAEKGSKLARYDLIPVRPLNLLAEHFGRGARKYADRNWERGYRWSLSYAALHRHLAAFWGGQDIDPETGSPHIIAAAWHCFALAEFMDTNKERDDRCARKELKDI